jgi:hypothetical protein
MLPKNTCLKRVRQEKRGIKGDQQDLLSSGQDMSCVLGSHTGIALGSERRALSLALIFISWSPTNDDEFHE